ncbi:hypothetical protein B0H17DRAFT_1150261, partial [Mycena rosella]
MSTPSRAHVLRRSFSENSLPIQYRASPQPSSSAITHPQAVGPSTDSLPQLAADQKEGSFSAHSAMGGASLDDFFNNNSGSIMGGGQPEIPRPSRPDIQFAGIESGMAATMHTNLSQETIRYSSVSGIVSNYSVAPDVPPFLAPMPAEWQLATSEYWTEPSRQSMESGIMGPISNAMQFEEPYQFGDRSDTETLTESRDTILTHHPAVVEPRIPPSPTLPAPIPEAGWRFRHPDPTTYYSASRIRSRQAILANVTHPTTGPIAVPYPPIEEWAEHVLLEKARDSQGIYLFEIISIPGHLLRAARELVCHGHLTGKWVILQ